MTFKHKCIYSSDICKDYNVKKQKKNNVYNVIYYNVYNIYNVKKQNYENKVKMETSWLELKLLWKGESLDKVSFSTTLGMKLHIIWI